MKVITIKRALKIGNDILREGRRYVTSDHMCKQLVFSHPQAIEFVEDFNKYYKPFDGSDLSGKKLMIWRSGGIGDLLFISPNMLQLKKMYPDLEIKLACSSRYAPLWNRHQLLVDGKSHPMPFDFELIEWADYHLHFEGIIESGGRAEYIHAVDLFSEYFKLEGKIPEEFRRPVLPDVSDLDGQIRKLLNKIGVNKSRPIVAFQFKASSPIRTFPQRRVIEIAKRIASEYNWNSLIVDSPHESDKIDEFLIAAGNPQGVFNITSKLNNIRETIALIKKIDILVAPDSSLCHIAGAIGMDKPTVALYGPFPSFVRTKYYPKCIPINAAYDCAPCFKHGHSPCMKAGIDGESPCFASIKTKMIIKLLRTIMKSLGKE
jgi:ADP-heptose:LPS heptosyltransferase